MAIIRCATPREGREVAKATARPRRRAFHMPTERLVMGAGGGEVIGDATSSGVLTDLIECIETSRAGRKRLWQELKNPQRNRKRAELDLGGKDARERWSSLGSGDRKLLLDASTGDCV